MRLVLLSLPLLFAVVVSQERTSDVTVETSRGTFRGKRVDYGNNQTQLFYGQADVFLGIPYARPPVGDLRFKRPIEAGAHSGVYDATYFRPRCPQNADPLRPFPSGLNMSEDCLYLNVFTRQASERIRQPVMIFIDGGDGFSSGGGDPNRVKGTIRNLVMRDIVVVTVQYRLGALGFFTTNSSEFPPNLGLLDQVKAIEWVKSEISHFGGNPAEVTLCGQGSGACSVSAHTLSPVSQRLFKRAILQSGAIQGCFYITPTTGFVQIYANDGTPMIYAIQPAAGNQGQQPTPGQPQYPGSSQQTYSTSPQFGSQQYGTNQQQQPYGQYGTTQQPYGQYSTTQSPNAQYGASQQQPYGQYGTSQQQPYGQYGTTQQPYGQYSTTQSPSAQYGTNQQPYGQGSTTQQPYGQYGTDQQSSYGSTGGQYGSSTATPYQPTQYANGTFGPYLIYSEQPNSYDRYGSTSSPTGTDQYGNPLYDQSGTSTGQYFGSSTTPYPQSSYNPSAGQSPQYGGTTQYPGQTQYSGQPQYGQYGTTASPQSQYGMYQSPVQPSYGSSTPNPSGTQGTAQGLTYDPSNPSQQFAMQACNMTAQQWRQGQLQQLKTCLHNLTFDIYLKVDGHRTSAWMIVQDNYFMPDTPDNLAKKRPHIPIIIGTVQDEDASYAFKLVANNSATQSPDEMFNNWFVDFARKQGVPSADAQRVKDIITNNYNVPTSPATPTTPSYQYSTTAGSSSGYQTMMTTTPAYGGTTTGALFYTEFGTTRNPYGYSNQTATFQQPPYYDAQYPTVFVGSPTQSTTLSPYAQQQGTGQSQQYGPQQSQPSYTTQYPQQQGQQTYGTQQPSYGQSTYGATSSQGYPSGQYQPYAQTTQPPYSQYGQQQTGSPAYQDQTQAPYNPQSGSQYQGPTQQPYYSSGPQQEQQPYNNQGQSQQPYGQQSGSPQYQQTQQPYYPSSSSQYQQTQPAYNPQSGQYQGQQPYGSQEQQPYSTQGQQQPYGTQGQQQQPYGTQGQQQPYGTQQQPYGTQGQEQPYGTQGQQQPYGTQGQQQPYGTQGQQQPYGTQQQPYGTQGQEQPYGTQGQQQPYGTQGQQQPYGTQGQQQSYTTQGQQPYGSQGQQLPYGTQEQQQPYGSQGQQQPYGTQGQQQPYGTQGQQQPYTTQGQQPYDQVQQPQGQGQQPYGTQNVNTPLISVFPYQPIYVSPGTFTQHLVLQATFPCSSFPQPCYSGDPSAEERQPPSSPTLPAPQPTVNYANTGIPPTANRTNVITNLKMITQISSDAGSVSNTAKELDLLLGGANPNPNVRIYEFVHVTEIGQNRIPDVAPWKPVYQGVDIYFVWMDEDAWSNNSRVTTQDISVANMMGQRWADFVKTGNVAGWAPSNRDTYQYCTLNSAPQMQSDYAHTARSVFNDVIPRAIDKDFRDTRQFDSVIKPNAKPEQSWSISFSLPNLFIDF